MILQPKYVVLFVVISLLLAGLISGCLAQPFESVPEELIGSWHGDSHVRLPITFNPTPDSDPTNDVVLPVAIDIAIHEDGTVTGVVGGAELRGCVLKQNRGVLGRQLNIATDYVIMDGTLEGPIVEEDNVPEKGLSIPFNIVDTNIQGSLFWTKEWKYPLPLMPRIELEKQG